MAIRIDSLEIVLSGSVLTPTKQALHTDYIEIYATLILFFSEIISLTVEQYVIMK